MNGLRGIFPALLTPMDNEGRINEKALADMVNLHLSQGVKGFYITGSASECHLMDESERMFIAEVIRELTKGKAVVIEHVGSLSTDLSVRLARHASKIGVDAVSAIPPFFYKYDMDEIICHYSEITSEAGLPMIFYYFPAMSGVSFTVKDLLRFQDIPGVIGVKYTSQDLFHMDRLIRSVPNYIVYSGHDEILLAALSMGADGAIGSTFNFMYGKIEKLKRLFDEKKTEEALETQRQINHIIDIVLKAGNYQASKYLMRKYGIDCGGCRKPMKPLSDESREMLNSIMPLLD